MNCNANVLTAGNVNRGGGRTPLSSLPPRVLHRIFAHMTCEPVRIASKVWLPREVVNARIEEARQVDRRLFVPPTPRERELAEVLAGLDTEQHRLSQVCDCVCSSTFCA